jgi:hypothetical protein
LRRRELLNLQFAELLAEAGLSSGPVYATGILKGHEAARMVADAKSQHSIRPMTERIILEAASDPLSEMVDRLAKYYHSEYVMLNQPWIREVPFEQNRDRKHAEKGMTLNAE